MPRQRKRGIKGAGSVYQRKSDGRWTGSFIVEETGRRKYVYAPVNNNTQKVVHDLLQEALQQQKRGTLPAGKDQTLKDYLAYWLEKVSKPTTRVITYERYRGVINKHLVPGLGRVYLCKLTTQQVQTFVASKIESGLAPSTVRKIYSVLHDALDHAVKLKLVFQNVSVGVALPKVQKRKKVLLSKEQILKLIEVATEHGMEAFIKLGLMSGMRHGELLALRWANVDFEARTLSIVHNVVYLAKHGFVEGGPKTEAGTRVILLPGFVVKALKEHKKKQQVQKDLVGEKWRENDLIFCNRSGGFMRVVTDLARFRKVLVLAGLSPKMCVHDLRIPRLSKYIGLVGFTSF